MSTLLDDLYLCPRTGQNVEVLDGKVQCPSVKDSGDCEKSQPNITGCSVYVDANRAYAQSQPKCRESEIKKIVESLRPGIDFNDF